MKHHARITTLLLFLFPAASGFAQSVRPAATPPADEPVKLEEFKVTDQQDAYKGNTAITGTKTDVPLIDVPAPIAVITKEVIDDLAATDITDLYPLMGSVTEFSYGGTSMRGFRMAAPDPTRYNGVAGSPYNDFGISTLHNVEQIEILRGPVGLLYGDNEPGGMINIVTAKPKAKFGGSVALKAGSYDLLAGSAMVTGPIDAKKRFLYLVSASYTERGSFRNNYEQQMLNLTGSLTWVISEATRINLEVEDITNEQPGARIRGVPFLTLTSSGTLAPANTPGGRFFAPISHSPTEPTDFQNLYTTVYNARLDHAFSSRLRVNAFVRWFQSEAGQAYHEGNLLIAPAFRLQQREFRHQRRVNDEISWAVNAIGDYDVMRTRHKLLLGVEFSKVNRVFTTRTVPQAQIPPIDVLAPVYGRSYRDLYPTSLDGIAPNDTDKIRTGYYLQDQISLGERWRFMAGLRYEDFMDERRSPTLDSFSVVFL
jgi:iron complex outermembrane receptor protein